MQDIGSEIKKSSKASAFTCGVSRAGTCPIVAGKTESVTDLTRIFGVV